MLIEPRTDLPTIVESEFVFKNIKTKIVLTSCDGKDQVSHSLNDHGWKNYESPLPLIVANLVSKRDSIFLDIGANTGYYSLIAALAGSKEVRAYEPVPYVMEILESNILMNSATINKIKTFEVAIANANGRKTLYMPSADHGLIEMSASLNQDFRKVHSNKFEVNCITLDSHLESYPIPNGQRIILKIDVESLELDVLRGSAKAIKTLRPLIILEILPETDEACYYEWAYKNNYEHCVLSPPNSVLRTKSIKGINGFYNHLFFPYEKPLNYWI